MSTNPTISILTPVRNGLPYIQECIDSVLSQDFQDWEMIISDNLSTDGTQAYLNTLSDPRIQVYKQKENIGIFGNLNFLLKSAKAPIAKILCADDTFLSGGLREVVDFMSNRPQCAVSRCLAEGDSKRFSHNGPAKFEGMLPEYIYPKATALAFATFGNLVGNLSKAACRPNLVLQVGGFDQQFPYAGDYEGWIRVALKFGIYLNNKELVMERKHEAQNSNLLNRKNELLAQQNTILNNLAAHVDETSLLLLKRHWATHHLAPRFARSVRQALKGDLQLAKSNWQDLPLDITALSCLIAYPMWKLRLPIVDRTTQKLLNRIQELNIN